MHTDSCDVPIGILSALRGELGSWPGRAERTRRIAGLDVFESNRGDRPVLATVAGVGKVAAAHGASVLITAGARILLIVGTAGGLRRGLVPGTMVHCRTAFQADLAVRETRQVEADPDLLAAWSSATAGETGWFLTADRPVLTPWRRFRLARAFAGPCVADMETAAAGAVAHRAGVPWAALRAVTDRAGWGASLGFRKNYPGQAGRAADAVEDLLRVLASTSGLNPATSEPRSRP